MVRFGHCAALAAAILCASAAHGQTTRPERLEPPALPGGLIPVDPVVEDVGALSLSLRTLERGLQHPSAFNRVYRMPGFGNQFVRVDGGLYAVFPQSAYAPSREGAVPLIPGGTEYYMGDPTGAAYRPANGTLGPPRAITAVPMGIRIDSRIDVSPEPLAESPRARVRPGSESNRATEVREVPGVIEPIEPPSQKPLNVPGTMFGDEDYRAARLLELLSRAVRAEQESAAP
ncbi:MAG TPA: hypothetical protein PK098_13425 [Phycisphaerales bacterium]|nr:hypothetical protein [Phycisphaerales bacterium]